MMQTLTPASAHHRLMELYEEWRRLTEEEAAAIRSWSWSRLEECHAAKVELQHRILEIEGHAGTDQRSLSRTRLDPDVENAPGLQLRQVLDQLMRLETRNQALLFEQVQLGTQRREELDRSVRNLRQVHRAYAARQGNSWHSYS